MAHTRLTAHARPVLLVCGLAALAAALSAPASAASTVEARRAGDAVLVESIQQTKELDHGGSATEFSLRLPEGSTCPGDSLHDQWRVQSFMVPDGDDPATLSYGVMGPEGPGQFPLFLTTTTPLTDSLTLANASAGLPALIPAIPALSFVAFPPDVLAPGTYRVGIACTLSRQTADYWNTTIVVSRDTDDAPSQLVWRRPDVPLSALENDSSGLPTSGIVAAALAVVALGAVLFLRRPSRHTTLSKETR